MKIAPVIFVRPYYVLPVILLSVQFIIVSLAQTSNKYQVDGGWGLWMNSGEWPCSVTCREAEGIKFEIFTRNCDRPIPQYGGKDCVGHVHKNLTFTCRGPQRCNVKKRTVLSYVPHMILGFGILCTFCIVTAVTYVSCRYSAPVTFWETPIGAKHKREDIMN